MWKTLWGWLTGSRKKNPVMAAATGRILVNGHASALTKAVIVVHVPVAYSVGGNPGAFILDAPPANLQVWRPTPKIFVLPAGTGAFV